MSQKLIKGDGRGRESSVVDGREFRLDGGQFGARVSSMILEPSALIPIAAVGEIAFDLVQHGVNPRGSGVAFELLNQVVCGVPVAGESEVDGLNENVFWSAHGGFLTAKRYFRKGDE